MNGSFCFFFQKEALAYVARGRPANPARSIGSFLKKRTKKLFIVRRIV
jgi:hypothetical protein